MTFLTQSDQRTYAIIGAAFEVHKLLGSGFLEPVYQEALQLEFTARAIPYNAQDKYEICYKGQILEAYYRPDFICFNSVVVELKALSRLSSIEESQLINYLKVTGHQTGVLSILELVVLRSDGSYYRVQPSTNRWFESIPILLRSDWRLKL